MSTRNKCRWCKGTRKITLARTIVDCTECTPEIDSNHIFIRGLAKFNKSDITNPCGENPWPEKNEPLIYGHSHKIASGSGASFVAMSMGWFSPKAFASCGGFIYSGPNDSEILVTEVTSLTLRPSSKWSDIQCVAPVGHYIRRAAWK